MILQVDIDLVILGCRPFFSQVFKNGGSKIRNHTHLEKKTRHALDWMGNWFIRNDGHICNICFYILNISAYLRDQIKSCFFSSCKFARDLFKGRVLFFYPRGFFHQEIPELINLRSNRPRRELLESPLFSGVKWPSGKPMYQAIFFGAPCHSIGFWTHQTYFQIHELRINV